MPNLLIRHQLWSSPNQPIKLTRCKIKYIVLYGGGRFSNWLGPPHSRVHVLLATLLFHLLMLGSLEDWQSRRLISPRLSSKANSWQPKILRKCENKDNILKSIFLIWGVNRQRWRGDVTISTLENIVEKIPLTKYRLKLEKRPKSVILSYFVNITVSWIFSGDCYVRVYLWFLIDMCLWCVSIQKCVKLNRPRRGWKQPKLAYNNRCQFCRIFFRFFLNVFSLLSTPLANLCCLRWGRCVVREYLVCSVCGMTVCLFFLFREFDNYFLLFCLPVGLFWAV